MIPELQPGDGIIYTGSTWYDRIQEVKLGSDATHFEVYMGDGMGSDMVATSLLATGVDIYPMSSDEILRIIRPLAAFDGADAMMKFSNTIRFKPYGLKGLLNFTDRSVPDDGIFCSQVGVELYRSQGIEPFNAKVEARKVAPMHFLYVSDKVFEIIY